MIAGSIGASLCDLAMGYTVYVPFTIVAKGLEGFICGMLIKAFSKKVEEGSEIIQMRSPRWGWLLLAYIISALTMVFGYFIANGILINWQTSLVAAVPFDLIQGGVSVFLTMILVFGARLDKLFAKLYKNEL
jgi:uncharacterized membrane protein